MNQQEKMTKVKLTDSTRKYEKIERKVTIDGLRLPVVELDCEKV